MKKVLTILTLLLSVGTLRAQEFIAGVEFDTYFDNREYAGNDFGTPRTLFSGQLVPQVGVQWDKHNRVVFGVELLRHFGDKVEEGDALMSDVKPRMYYRFQKESVTAFAGIFSFRELTTDSYSRAIFSDETLFYHPCISGFMGRYTSRTQEDSFVELALDWEGMYSKERREAFRVISAGRYDLGRSFYFGYGLSVFHFAKSEVMDNVTDNIIVNPYFGKRFTAWFDFDIRLGALVAPQRGRSVDNKWQLPAGGELDITLYRKGFRIENNLYVGENLQPLRHAVSGTVDGVDLTYGEEGLYAGEDFFATTKKIYNRTWVGYDRAFFDETVAVKAGMVFHYDGSALGSQQMVQLSVSLEKLFGTKKK